MNFTHYFSYDKLNEVFDEVLSKRNLSAGLDRYSRINLTEFRKISDNMHLYHKLILNGFKPRRFQILRETKISISSSINCVQGKIRLICKPSIYDRPAFLILKNYLQDNLRKKTSNVRSVIDSLKNEINAIYDKKTESQYSILKLDIDSFYDSINRDILKDELINKYKIDNIALMFIDNIFETYIRSFNKELSNNEVKTYEQIETSDSFPSLFKFNINVNKGIPQGLPISNILAELYVDDIEKHIKKFMEKRIAKCSVYRYVDDMVLIVKSNNLERIKEEINNYEYKGLKFNQTKEKVTGLWEVDQLIHFNLFGFNLKKNESGKNKFSLVVEKTNLDDFINKIEKKFSDFKNKYNRLSSTEENGSESSDVGKLFERRIIELVKFKCDIDLLITGYISDKITYGWIHYYHIITNPAPLILIDNMIKKFKNRDNHLSKISFKSMYITYKYLDKKQTNKNLYIPNIDLITKLENEQLLNDFLYHSLMYRFQDIKQMGYTKKKRIINDFIYNRNFDDKYIDIKRGKAFYVTF